MLVQVIHYELPNTSELFVHRSGRTARAGKKGSAILIYTNDQARAVRIIEQDIGCKFTELPKIAVADEASDMFNVVRDNRSRLAGSPRTGGSSFGQGGYGGFGEGRSRGFGDFDGFGSSPDRGGRSRDAGSRYGSGFGDFRRPSNAFGRSSSKQPDGFGFGDFGEGNFSRNGNRRSRSFDDSGSTRYSRRPNGFGTSDFSRSGGFDDSN